MTAAPILHITATWFDQSSVIGGGERYPCELALAQSRLHATRLLSFSDQEKEFEVDNSLEVRLIKRQWGSKFSPFSFKLYKEIKAAKIVHIHQYHSLASNFATLLCKLLGKKVYLSDLGGGAWNLGFYYNFNRWITASCDISKYAKSKLQRPAKKHHVIYAGVDCDKFKPCDKPMANYALYVGRVMPHKGVDSLISALPENMKLKIVGRRYDEEFYQHCLKLAETKNVIFIDDANDEDLIHLYQNAQVLILPSVTEDYKGNISDRSELFGLVLVEAMACGLPVVASNITSIPEIISDPRLGFLYEQGQVEQLHKILCKFQNNEIDPQMGTNARKHVLEHFTWKQVAQKCLEIYES
jgi:glycosyltransferase involved in cell wall biosynthesis